MAKNKQKQKQWQQQMLASMWRNWISYRVVTLYKGTAVVWRFLIKLVGSYHTPRSLHPRALVPEKRRHIHTESCPWMFTAAVFVTAPNWKQPRCLLRGKRLKPPWFTHSLEHHSTVNGDKPLTQPSKWISRERSRVKKGWHPKRLYSACDNIFQMTKFLKRIGN